MLDCHVNTQDIETSTVSHENTSDPYLPPDAAEYNETDIETKYDEEGKIQYWCNTKYNRSTDVKTSDPFPAEFSRVILETQH